MSVFILPSTQSFHPFTGGHQSPFHGGRRCAGRLATTTTDVQSPFDVLFNDVTNRNVHHYSSRHHPFFSQEVEEEDEEDELRQYFLHQQHQQQRRQAAQIALARRQVEIERERERERRRIRQQQIQSQRQRRAALLAQIAWQEEQARLHRLAIAEEEQQQRQRQQYRKLQERRAAAAALQQKQQWQEIASHGLATALQFAEWFGGLGEEEEEDTEMAEKTGNPSNNSETADQADHVTIPQPEQISVPIIKNEQDPPEEDISKDNADAASEPIPIFTHPLPNDSTQRASLNAKDIQVTFDQPTNTIKVSGLWDVNTNENEDELVALSSSSSSSVTTNDDQEETRGRKRSRSPKRSRVSDVDEITGEEILVDQEENKDGFVNVAAGKQPQGSIQIPLPKDANVSNLRAELTDEGFKLFL